jgi:predicted nuclease with TOPRIM domain
MNSNKENDSREEEDSNPQKKDKYKREAAKFKGYWESGVKENVALQKEKEQLLADKNELLSEKSRLLNEVGTLQNQVAQLQGNVDVAKKSDDKELQKHAVEMLKMVCYSMVRGYPTIEKSSKKRRGHKNKGIADNAKSFIILPKKTFGSHVFVFHFSRKISTPHTG